MNCLVSGATGFVGRQLCRSLCERGETVSAFSLNGGALAPGLNAQAIDLAAAAPDFTRLPGDIDVVFHVAGVAHQHATAAAYEQVNYRATLALAAWAAATGVRRFIYLSSVKAMGRAADSAPRTETQTTLPVDPYGLSKWHAECALRARYADGPLSVAIVRPTLLYGPGVGGNLGLLARAVPMGLPRPPAAGRRSLLAVQDLVELLYTLARTQPCGVQTWIAAGEESYSSRELHDLLRAADGRGPARGWLPAAGWRLAAGLADLLTGAARGSTWDKLFGTELYSAAAVMAGTGWRPRVHLAEAIGSLAAAEQAAS